MDKQLTVTQTFGAAASGKPRSSPGKGAGNEKAARAGSEEEAFDAAQALVLLLAGALLEGNDALLVRLRRWQAAATDSLQAETAKSSPPSFGFSLLGLLLQSPATLRRQWLRADKLSTAFLDLASLPLKRVAGSRLFQPAQRRFEALVSEGESRLAAWAETAEAVEPAARAMAQTATRELIDDVIRHLSENPELAAMIQTQSVGLAGEVADNIRSRTVSADMVAERLARSLLRRQPRPEVETQPTTADA